MVDETVTDEVTETSFVVVESNAGAIPSTFHGFTYRPQRGAARKGAHERTKGHEWVCDKCLRIAHTEPLAGMDETIDEASIRHGRIFKALVAHGADHVGGVVNEHPARPD